MEILLEKLAKLTESTLQGDGKCLISGINAIDVAKQTDISFLSNNKFKKFLHSTQASAMILSPSMAKNWQHNALIHSNPYLIYAKVTAILFPPKKPIGIHPTAVIDSSVKIGKSVFIGAKVVIDSNTIIADNVIIEASCYIGSDCQLDTYTHLKPNVTLVSNCKIGKNTLIHSGAIIGADGFGFAPEKEKWVKIMQIGQVIIGNDVEIGANTTIDRAALGETVIGNGVKLDNLIQIGHNVKIGDHTIIAACSRIAGSAIIGKRCRIAGASSIGGHIRIADDVTITATTLVIHSITKAGVYSSGLISDENKKWRRNTIRFKQLDKMAQKLKNLERILKDRD